MDDDTDESRRRLLAIVAGTLVARHLKTAEDLHDRRPRPCAESLIASPVQRAKQIRRRIDATFSSSIDEKPMAMSLEEVLISV